MNDAAFVEAVDLGALERHQSAWRGLAGRAAEANVFAEPAFLLPALQRLAPRWGMTRLLVWSSTSREALIGLVVLRKPPFGLARVWRGEQAGLAATLWDSDALARALEGVSQWLRARGFAGVIWPAVEAEGRFARELRALAGARLEVMNPRRRAAFIPAGAEAFEAGLDKKRRKEWARQARRLAEQGRFEARVARDPAAIERFLALEATGWKGARGTALAADAARRAFARETLEGFAREGTLDIHEFLLNDATVASGIVLRSGARAFYWKTAYDERFAEFSPGVQLTLTLSRALAVSPDLALVDSCALENHPMIDRLWLGRLDLVDLALASPGCPWRFTAMLAVERAMADARDRVKVVVNQWRGRKRS